MKKKFLLGALSLALCGALILPACGEGSTTGGGSGSGTGTGGSGEGTLPTGTKATITMYTAVNIIERNSLEAVAKAYKNLQKQKGNNITVDISNVTTPDSYSQNMKNMAATGVKEPTIVSVSVLPEYHGTNKIVDLSGYLEEPNPYNPDYETWKDSMEPDAYRSTRAGSTVTIPGISYSSNYTCAFYSKDAVKAILKDDPLVAEDGTIDASRITWTWMMNALQKATEFEDSHGKVFRHPFGVSNDANSCGQASFNIFVSLQNMYLDQYFRDFIDEVHSEEGDYSYVRSIDGKWQYDVTDPEIDLASRYTYNHNKVVDDFFNKSEEYGPQSPRYKEVMENLYDLMQYGSDEAYQSVFDNFNRTWLTYGYGSNNPDFTNLKLFYVETLGYVRTYRDSINKSVTPGKYPSMSEITSKLGWFLLPAMESDLEGVAQDVRAWGGPLENYGVLTTGDASKDAIAIDFLKYLYSPLGQERISQQYQEENYAPQVMRQLVKGNEVPADIDCTAVAKMAKGDSCSNPYINFGAGNGLSFIKKEGKDQYIYEDSAALLSNYLCGGVREWTQGASLLNIFKSGFKSYAEHYGLVYDDPANVSAATDGLKNSPYSATA